MDLMVVMAGLVVEVLPALSVVRQVQAAAVDTPVAAQALMRELTAVVVEEEVITYLQLHLFQPLRPIPALDT